MAQLIDITRVEVGARTLTARVRLSEDAPVMTSEDLEGTSRLYYVMPSIADHACLGDADGIFKNVMGNTELAHLLEHVTVELLARTNVAGDVSVGRTYPVVDMPRTWDIELACPDDVLVAAALASAAWLLQWAYTGGIDPEPDIDATVSGLVGLVESLPQPDGDAADEQEDADLSLSTEADELHELPEKGQSELSAEEDAERAAVDADEATTAEDDTADADTKRAEDATGGEEGPHEHIPEPHAIR